MLAASSSPLGTLTNDDLLDMIVSAGLEPRVLYPNGFRRRSRFAFVIHPLSQRFLTQRRAAAHHRAGVARRSSWTASRRRMAYAPADDVQPDHRHHLPHRRRGRGLADHRGRHAQGADGAQPGVHLRPAAGRRGRGQEARRPDHGPRRVHQGRRRRRRHGGQAGAAADHHRQQLQRLRRAVGRARGPRAPRPVRASTSTAGSRARRWSSGATGRDRLGLRPAAGPGQRRAVPDLAGDRQAAGAQGRHRAGEPARVDPHRGDARRGTCPRWT